MNKKRQFTFVVLFGLVWIIVLGSACSYTECTCDSAQIMCQSLNLRQIPPLTADISTQVFLYFDNNMITAIPAGSLPPNLTEISFTSNPITTIDVAAFDDSSNTLMHLVFSGALFTRIPDAFLHLNVLNYFDISHTIITDWNENVMRHIGSTLGTVSLDSVGLKTWPNWVQYFSQVTEVSIINSTISFIPEDALDVMVNNLRTLDLINCKLLIVPKALSKLQAVQSIQLMQNEISDVTWLPSSSQLYSLSLNSNNLRDAQALSNSLRPFADTLANIDLVNNHLTSIPDMSFLIMVGNLDLSQNQISDPVSGNLPGHMYDLDLRENLLPNIPDIFSRSPIISRMLLTSNLIKDINASDFPSSIIQVDLGYNMITKLSDNSFPQNSGISSISLNNNPLIQIADLAFKGLSQLTSLNLMGTKISRLPLALGSLQSLTSLDMTSNNYLVCTCVENTLENWIIQSGRNILGSCGETSIYNFFAILSSNCP